MAVFSCTAQFLGPLGLVTPLPLFELRSAPTCAPLIKKLGIKEITGGFNQSWSIGVARGDMANSVVIAGNKYQPMAGEDPSAVNNLMLGLNVYSEWQSRPPTPTVHLRRAVLRNPAGTAPANAEFVFRFQRGLSPVGTTGTIIVWLLGPATPGVNVLLGLELSLEVDG